MDSPHGDPRKIKNFCSREEARVLMKIQGRTAALPVACFGLEREEYATEYQQRHTSRRSTWAHTVGSATGGHILLGKPVWHHQADTSFQGTLLLQIPQEIC